MTASANHALQRTACSAVRPHYTLCHISSSYPSMRCFSSSSPSQRLSRSASSVGGLAADTSSEAQSAHSLVLSSPTSLSRWLVFCRSWLHSTSHLRGGCSRPVQSLSRPFSLSGRLLPQRLVSLLDSQPGCSLCSEDGGDVRPNHALQRTRPSRRDSNRGVPRAGSLSLGRSV